MSILEKGAPLPAELGRCADLLHDVQTLRLAMQKEVDAIEAREKEISAHLIDSIAVGGGAVGQRYVIAIDRKEIPTVTDWGVLYSWIRKNDRFDLLHKRLSESTALEAMAERGEPLPGTTTMYIKKVSLTKR